MDLAVRSIKLKLKRPFLYSHEEESFHGLAELLAVAGISNEVAPCLGHALEPADGHGRDAGEDLDEEIDRRGGRPPRPRSSWSSPPWHRSRTICESRGSIEMEIDVRGCARERKLQQW